MYIMDIIDFAEQLNDLIAENRELKLRNMHLEEMLQIHIDYQEKQLAMNNKHMGDIFITLLNKEG